MTDKELCDLLRTNIPYEAPRCLEAADRIEALNAENERLREAIASATDFFRTAPLESGYCCCGDAVEAHGMWSGHSPVDELAYYASGIEKQLRAALGDEA